MYNNQGNRPPAMYCGGYKSEWKQGRNGNYESIRAWFSFRQAFQHAYGEQGWQQIAQLLSSLQPVQQNVIRNRNNGDVYIKLDIGKRRQPSQTGDTHSVKVNTYVGQPQQQQYAPQQGGFQQQSGMQGNFPAQTPQQQTGYQNPAPAPQAPPPPPFPPAPPVQAPAPEQRQYSDDMIPGMDDQPPF